MFLQHPFANEVLPGAEYDNPHYLLRPGAEMPKIEDLSLGSDDEVSGQIESENDTGGNLAMRVFEAVEADGGEIVVPDAQQSPRLRTTLLR